MRFGPFLAGVAPVKSAFRRASTRLPAPPSFYFLIFPLFSIVSKLYHTRQIHPGGLMMSPISSQAASALHRDASETCCGPKLSDPIMSILEISPPRSDALAADPRSFLSPRPLRPLKTRRFGAGMRSGRRSGTRRALLSLDMRLRPIPVGVQRSVFIGCTCCSSLTLWVGYLRVQGMRPTCA